MPPQRYQDFGPCTGMNAARRFLGAKRATISGSSLHQQANSARFWTAPAERSDDGAFERTRSADDSNPRGACESGVALRLPPQSKTLASEAAREQSLNP
jgi:hypothetical protein